MPSSRQASGHRAEAAAADYLTAAGYDVVAHNVREGHLELDLLARRGDLLAVVEVRARRPGAVQGALASFSRTKSERVRRATRLLWERTWSRDPSIGRVRIDVAAVTFEGRETRVEHVEGVLA